MKRCIVNSLPKSGTNMLRRFLTLCGMEYATHFPPTNDNFKVNTPFSKIGVPIGTDYVRVTEYERLQKLVETLMPQQFFTAHTGYTNALLQLVRENQYAMILLIRDPRAVLNSFVHYVSQLKRHPMHAHLQSLGTEDRFLFAIKGGWAGRAYLEPIEVQIESLRPCLNAKDVLQVRFEDMVGVEGGGKAESQMEIAEKIANLIGLERDAIQPALNSLFGDSATFRSGQIMKWKEEMPMSAQILATQVLECHLQEFGYVP